MENLPRNPQRYPPVSRMLDDLLELLVDLDVTSDRDAPKSNLTSPLISPPTASQPAPNSDRTSNPELIAETHHPRPTNGHRSSPQGYDLITAHRQSLLKSLSLPIPPAPSYQPKPTPPNPQPPSALVPPPPSQSATEVIAHHPKPAILNGLVKASDTPVGDNLGSESSPGEIVLPVINSETSYSEISYPETSHAKINHPEISHSETNHAEIHPKTSNAETVAETSSIVLPVIIPENKHLEDKHLEDKGINPKASITETSHPQTLPQEPMQAGDTVASLGLLMDFVLSSQDKTLTNPALELIDPVLPSNPVSNLVPNLASSLLSDTVFNPQSNLVLLPEIKALITSEKPREDIQEINNLLVKPSRTKIVIDDEEKEEDPLDILQRLLVSPEVYDVQKLSDSLERKLTKIEAQLYNPDKLIDLLLPTIAELLSLKISQSRAEVVAAITPIIDEVIQHRIEQDRVAMSGAIAPIISEAISKQISDSPEEIANAIGPTMGKAIQEQIRLEKDSMVDALYPIIGSTISKYMGEEIANINRQVENAFSVEGLKRKVQAKLQGVSEAELILREALPFTVLAVFLIHKNSGLLIADAQPPQEQQLESDMIAGMLTAIRSFANDCMTNNDNSSELNQIDYSDSKIVLEVAGYCYLALVVRGQMTEDFVKKFRRSMTTIIRIYNKPIMNFDGDRSTIPAEVNVLLEDMIINNKVEAKARSKYPVTLGLVILGVIGIITIPLGIYQHRQSINNQIAQQVTTALDKTPELSIYRLEAQVVDETVRLNGKVPNAALQNRAGTIAKQTSAKLAIDNRITVVDIPLDTSFTAAEVYRTTIVLNKIPGVMISSKYKEGTLEINGMVKDRASIANITKAMQNIPGIKVLSNQIQLGNINQEGISRRIYFEAGSATVPADSLPQINEIKTLLSINPSFKLKITGYTDATGDVADNQRLSTARAANVQQILLDQGIEQRQLEAKGSTGQVPGVTELWQGRFVEFELIAPNIQN